MWYDWLVGDDSAPGLCAGCCGKGKVSSALLSVTVSEHQQNPGLAYALWELKMSFLP